MIIFIIYKYYLMSVYTSSLPDELLRRLDKASKALSLPKNKLIEKALSIYLDQLNRAEYLKSYKQAGDDREIMAIAEEGIIEYFKKLEKE